MSSENRSKSFRKITRRSIPRLISKDGQRRNEETGSPGEDSSKADVSSTTQSHKSKLPEKKTWHQSHREKIEDVKRRPVLSLQGPFNPDIVGHRKTSEESKRKRNVLSTSTEGPERNLFPSVKADSEDNKTKRSHHEEKSKQCHVDFSQKSQIKFSSDLDKPVVFTATSNKNGASKSHPRVRHASSAGPTTRHGSHIRSERVLKEMVQQLEKDKEQLTEQLSSQVQDLTQKIKAEKVLSNTLSEENVALKKDIENLELKNAAAIDEEKASLMIQNEAMEKRLDRFQQKLEDLSIDPVSLTEMEGADPANLVNAHTKAVEAVEKLRLKMEAINKKNREIIDTLKGTNGNGPNLELSATT